MQVNAANTVNAVNAMANGASPAAGTPAPAAGAAAPAQGVGAKTVAPAPAEAAVDIHTPFKQSFFFTAEDIIAIHKAIEQQNAPAGAIGQAGGGPAAPPVIPPVRRIALAGVIYKAADDWLIWINGQKVTPNVSMKEIVDIKVESDSRVHLKWFDIGLNGVIDITMRPNETYDIVTGVLLPGIIK
jgi:hypothetical protein